MYVSYLTREGRGARRGPAGRVGGVVGGSPGASVGVRKFWAEVACAGVHPRALPVMGVCVSNRSAQSTLAIALVLYEEAYGLRPVSFVSVGLLGGLTCLRRILCQT